MPCPVCGDTVSGLHYGVATCESCKLFFKRTEQERKQCMYICRGMRPSLCKINKSSRRWCRYCRYNKCIKVGMKPEMVNLKPMKIESSWSMSVIPRYSWSRAGNTVIILGEYRFKKRSKHINQKKEVHWVCNKCDIGCKAKLTTVNDAIVKISNIHDHGGHRKRVAGLPVKSE